MIIFQFGITILRKAKRLKRQALSASLFLAIPFALLFPSCNFTKPPESTHERLIRETCSQPNRSSPVVSNELAVLLNKVQDDFKDRESRIKNKEAFVFALDQVLTKSKFAQIAECRQGIEGHGYKYMLRFIDPLEKDAVMAVEKTSDKKVILHFNLNKPVQRVLFTYLHEMSHVCQIPEMLGSRSVGDVIRLSMFGEVEAFHNMSLAYREFLSLSSRLCREEGIEKDAPSSPLFEFYIGQENSMTKGSFAQEILHSYMKDTSIYKKFEAELLNLKSPLHEYFSQEDKAKFQMHSLDARLKQLLQRLPISVTEP